MTSDTAWWKAALAVVAIVVLGCVLLLAFNYFFFADVGLESPSTEPPSQLIVPLLGPVHRRLSGIHSSAAQPRGAHRPKRSWKGRVAP